MAGSSALSANPAAAEDLTVETFWRIYRMHARFDPARSFEPWARRIATNAAFEIRYRFSAEVSCNPVLSPRSQAALLIK